MSAEPMIYPKLVLCLVGDERFPEVVEELLQDEELEFEVQREPDPRMVEAFRAAAAALQPTIDAAELEKIAAHRSVVYLISENYPPDEAIHVAHEMLAIGVELLESGGIAMKCESSGVAHSAELWTKLAGVADEALELASDENLESDDEAIDAFADFWSALVQAFVQLPILTSDDYKTCGLHLLGVPDLIIGRDLMQDLSEDDESPDTEAAGLFLLAALTHLMQDRDAPPETFDTFRIDEESPEFRVREESCDDIPADDLFFNPFGRRRLMV